MNGFLNIYDTCRRFHTNAHHNCVAFTGNRLYRTRKEADAKAENSDRYRLACIEVEFERATTTEPKEA